MALYRVTARRKVLGYDPGTEFEADLDEVQEERLVAGGHLVCLDEPLEPYEVGSIKYGRETVFPGDEELPS